MIEYYHGSPQLVELKAVVMVFEKWPGEPLNIISDSQYVCNIVQRLERSVLKTINNNNLFCLLKALWMLITSRQFPYYILRIRSHTSLPGYLQEGNARADRLTAPAWAAPTPDIMQQAIQSHAFFHQTARALSRQFHISKSAAQDIVTTCAECQKFTVAPPTGANPRGLRALQLWQTDVTHGSEFGRLQYLHVSVDTFLKAIWASVHSGEKARDVISHWRGAFAVLGIPKIIRTDNGSGYIAQRTQDFLKLWGVQHTTGIPHSPTGQAIVERTHQTLKHLLEKQKKGMSGETPHARVMKAVYVFNHLTVPETGDLPILLNHFLSLQASDSAAVLNSERPPVWTKNLHTGGWEGPHELITWGRGYACVSTPTGLKWVPARHVRPYLSSQ